MSKEETSFVLSGRQQKIATFSLTALSQTSRSAIPSWPAWPGDAPTVRQNPEKRRRSLNVIQSKRTGSHNLICDPSHSLTRRRSLNCSHRVCISTATSTTVLSLSLHIHIAGLLPPTFLPLFFRMFQAVRKIEKKYSTKH